MSGAAPTSPFFNLPSSIRSKIYSYLFSPLSKEDVATASMHSADCILMTQATPRVPAQRRLTSAHVLGKTSVTRRVNMNRISTHATSAAARTCISHVQARACGFCRLPTAS
ncbi:hypothetical protein M3J09_000911 [Ascochyta lentis]